jgi:mRNA m6A methyltransferase non-catalytic subunit
MGQGQDERLVSLNDTQGTVNVEGEEGGRATKWDRESWEEGIKELSNGGKAVVPMTSEIDALRPKSPFRPNQSNPTGAMPVAGGAVNPRFVSGNRTGFVGGPQGMQAMGQNQMIMQPMMGMGMNSMGMGMGAGVDEMMGAWNPMMGGMGNMNVPTMGNMNVGGMGGMNTTSMGNVGRLGMPMMGGGGFGAGTGMYNVGMGWADQGQFGMEGGWDGDAMMAAGVGGMGNEMNMNGMNTMNMNGGMVLGQWGAGPGTFEGFH